MAQSVLLENVFKNLSRMFSRDVVVRRVGAKKLKVVDTYNSQAMGSLSTNYLGAQYRNLYSSLNYGYNQSLSIQSQRLMLFREYELMEQDPIINSALDLYSEEATVKDEYGKILSISSDDKEIAGILENLFYDILNIDFNLIHWTRNLVKYGDMMMKLDMAEKMGIINAMPLSPYGVTRIEGDNVDNPYDTKYKVDGPIMQGTYENYEIAHFRLLTDINFLPYGKSMIEGARRIWKQLTLMEDAMLIHRIMRAPMKRVFNIDVGNLNPNEVDAYMEKIVNNMKKVPYVDSSGNYNLKYNMQNISEDFYLPKRGADDSTSIDVLAGLEYNAIEDVEYLRNKLMAALRIPKAYLGYEEALGAKATLSQEDIRFARTIERIQKTLLAEFKNLAMIHLFIQGYQDEDLLNFDLQMASPSTVYEQEKIQIWKQKAELVDTIKNQKFIPTEWLYKNLFHLGEEEIKEYKEKVIEDTKFEYRLAQIVNEGQDPDKTGQHVDNDGTVRSVDDPDKIDVVGSDIDDKKDNNGNNGKVGRPPEGKTTYKTDKSPLGRNPLGQDDIRKSNKLNRASKQPFNLETIESFKKLSKKYLGKQKMLREQTEILQPDALKDLLKED